MQRLTLLLLLAACIAIGCESETTPADAEESLSLTISGFKPSRPNEIYALWIEFPASTAAPKHSPQHGESIYKLVSTFDVASNGDLLGLDASNLAEKLGISLELAKHGLISVEKKDSIGPEPNIEFLVGEVTGTATTGSATLKHDHQEAVAYPLQTLSAEATLASPASAPDDYMGEVYLMRATDPATPQASITGLIPLPSKWRYALWAIDSSTRSLPPFNIFYGYFSQVAQADSNPDDNRFSFPGGRYPAATSEAVYPLISGNVTLMVSLEPNFGYSRPSVPFGAIVLETKIPENQAAFTPFALGNMTLKLPQATLILNR